MSIIDTLITDRSVADMAANNDKAYYNATDLNRVGEALLYVARRLSDTGYPVKITAKTDWTTDDVPLKPQMEEYLSTVTTIRNKLPVPASVPQVPVDMDYLTFEEANNIEKILTAVEQLITNMTLAWFYCGDLYCGEV